MGEFWQYIVLRGNGVVRLDFGGSYFDFFDVDLLRSDKSPQLVFYE